MLGDWNRLPQIRRERESLARTVVAVLGDPSTHGRAVPLVPAASQAPDSEGSRA